MTLSLPILTGGREYVLSQLAADETWQRVTVKSPEGAASLLVQLAKRTALNEAQALILPKIEAFYKTYCQVNGPPPGEVSHDWYEGHDDGLLELFEQYVDVLSGSWLGFATTDIRLWITGEAEKLAKMFADEVWKQLTWKRSDNQILAGVGIVHADLAQFGYMPVEPVTKPRQEFSPMRVNAIINRIMLSMPDPATLEDDLDFASDEDDGLAIGAAERLGITKEDVAILREARSLSGTVLEAWKNAIDAGELLDETKTYVDLEPPSDVANPLVDDYPEIPAGLVRTTLPPLPPLPGSQKPASTLPPLPGTPTAPNGKGPPPPPPPASIATTEAVPAPGRKPRKGNEPPAGHIALETLKAIKDNAGPTDEDLANLLGISRPTLASIMKGKTYYVPPDQSRRDALIQMLDTRVNALSRARGQLMGSTT